VLGVRNGVKYNKIVRVGVVVVGLAVVLEAAPRDLVFFKDFLSFACFYSSSCEYSRNSFEPALLVVPLLRELVFNISCQGGF